MKKLFTYSLLTVFFTLSTVFASGFQINEHGARAMAMGGAFTGLANDASAVYLNPAGITQLSGTHLSFGATYIAPSSKFTGPVGALSTTSELKDQFFTPINVHFTHQLSDKITVGFTVNNPFGLGTKWEDDWVGRYSTVNTEIRTFNFTPVIAYKFSEKFSASIGVSLSYADVEITRKLQGLLPTGNPLSPYIMFPDAKITMEGDDGMSYGVIAGILYKASDKFSIGASFKSAIKYEFEGDAKVTYGAGTDATAQAIGSVAFPSGKITAPLTAPWVASIGIAYKANENFTLTSDLQINGWSTYDKLELTFEEWSHPVTGSNLSTSERDYENSFIFRMGGEYIVNCSLAIRAGILYDKNPVKDERLDPTLPDADRVGFNIGIGYKLSEKLSVDFGYFYLHFIERTIDNSGEFIPIQPTPVALNGVYESNAHLIGLNFNYNL